MSPSASTTRQVSPPVIAPSAAPFFHAGRPGGVGVVMIHGLTSSPAEVRPIADDLLRREPGLTVSCPLLPGHGTSPEELRRISPESWRTAVAAEVDRVAAHSACISLLGISLGAVLAADRAITDRRVKSLTMLAPVFQLRSVSARLVPLVRHFVRYIKKNPQSRANHLARGLFSYDRYPLDSVYHLMRLARDVRSRLHELDVPTLIAGGRRDRYSRWSAVESLRDSIGAPSVELVECENSGHVLPHEPDAPKLFDAIYRFLCEHHDLGASANLSR